MEKERICAVDIETTGLNPQKHAIIQVAIVPLTNDFSIMHQDAINIRLCSGSKVIDPGAIAINGLDPSFGIPEESLTLAIHHGIRKLGFERIVPLGQCYDTFDRVFLSDVLDWFGGREEGGMKYSDLFASRSRDPMRLAMAINDRYVCMGRDPLFVPYVDEHGKNRSGFGLSDICRTLQIAHSWPHDAVEDAVAAARAYKALLEIM